MVTNTHQLLSMPISVKTCDNTLIIIHDDTDNVFFIADMLIEDSRQKYRIDTYNMNIDRRN